MEITEVANLREIEKELKRQGGYAVTHVGTAERLDGKTFSTSDAEHLLNALRPYLSFARGGFSCPILPKGLGRNGGIVWEQWGAGPVLSFGYTPSWFDRAHGHLLSEVFPGFWSLFNDPQWANTIQSVLYWYLRSNAHGRGAGVDGGLILTQAGLERLAYSCLGNAGGTAAHRIRTMLEVRKIDTAIPKTCRTLRALAARYGWEDGPHALTEVRNQLVHPDARGKSVSGSYFEAWNLAQAYVELILLALFEHQGLYGDRLTQEWQGQVVNVPWV